MFFDQREFDVRCEWGVAGLRQLAATSDAIVIVELTIYRCLMTPSRRI